MGCEKGKLVICDRCGETVFLKYIKTEGGSNYGSDYDVYDNLPEDWLHETGIGYLCPHCANEFRKWITHFTNGKVSPKWRYEEPVIFQEV